MSSFSDNSASSILAIGSTVPWCQRRNASRWLVPSESAKSATVVPQAASTLANACSCILASDCGGFALSRDDIQSRRGAPARPSPHPAWDVSSSSALPRAFVRSPLSSASESSSPPSPPSAGTGSRCANGPTASSARARSTSAPRRALVPARPSGPMPRCGCPGSAPHFEKTTPFAGQHPCLVRGRASDRRERNARYPDPRRLGQYQVEAGISRGLAAAANPNGVQARTTAHQIAPRLRQEARAYGAGCAGAFARTVAALSARASAPEAASTAAVLPASAACVADACDSIAATIASV